VNFHQNPGRGTAGRADPTPTWPEPDIPYHVPSRWVPVGGAARWEFTDGSGARAPVRENGSLGRAVHCCVFSLSVSLLLMFPLFAVLLNCPYPYPPVSACFFPFCSTPRRGEGRPRGAFVAGFSQNQNTSKVKDFFPLGEHQIE